ncbi:MAG: hypothetical protein IKM72_11935 [Oscillospiraceae bacterium]|nr:hypothetical protein [Oscillospiraceae bacterium]
MSQTTSNYIRSVDDFKAFLDANREQILKNVVKIEDLPEDDEWFQEDEWDEIYEQEVLKSGKS